MDILGAVVGLLITGIVSIIVVPAIKLDSPGPAIYAQMRVGKNGRHFKMYKFRSMYLDADARKAELMAHNEMQGAMFKMENDPRITKVGKFIRKYSIDELPQFYNVLKGDMSLVGTRPPTVDEVEKYRVEQKRRLSVTPGMTGLWQVSGRSDIYDFDEIVKLDLNYIDQWSVQLDIKLIFKTIAVCFKGSGAK
jgi:lipopolysaccharide/colanic/teichoic acid biosynthesis glycosyltransferase